MPPPGAPPALCARSRLEALGVRISRRPERVTLPGWNRASVATTGGGALLMTYCALVHALRMFVRALSNVAAAALGSCSSADSVARFSAACTRTRRALHSGGYVS